MPRRNKYANKRVMFDGHKFDSKAEANRYAELKLLVKAGYITELELQKPFEILQKYVNGEGKNIREIKYVSDFYYYDVKRKLYVVEDVKAVKTKDYLIKKKLFEYMYKPLTITEINVRSK